MSGRLERLEQPAAPEQAQHEPPPSSGSTPRLAAVLTEVLPSWLEVLRERYNGRGWRSSEPKR